MNFINMKFTIGQRDKGSKARTGYLDTDHGQIETPVFMPVGTAGTVKAVHFKDLEHAVGAQIILGNTYHLYLRPGIEVIEAAGGLHRFIGWDKPTLTDSGGFQVYSLADSRKVSEEGVRFRSHIDGAEHYFTPEKVIDIQRSIGADIIMAFDECPAADSPRKYVEQSMELTHRWLERCFNRFRSTESLFNYSQALFPIVQGGIFPDLRKHSAETTSTFHAEGNAIGGLSVGEPEEVMYEMTELVCDILPDDKPRYLMGVGTPSNLLECMARGVDMFDCVMPTRNGRNARIFTFSGVLNIRNEKWKNDFTPLDDSGMTEIGSQCSRSYLRHLFMSNEMLGGMIASLQNLGLYSWLMKEARKQIEAGNFSKWKDGISKQLSTRL